LSAVNDYDDGGRVDAHARDRALRLRLWTNVAWGAAAVSAATSVTLFTVPLGSRGSAVSAGPFSINVSHVY
jgi:hypothetical protein